MTNIFSIAFRGYAVRKRYNPLINARTGKLDSETANFVRDFAKKWRAKTIYQVLLHYRCARFQDLVNFSQQVHIYNQRLVHGISLTSQCLLIDRIDTNQKHSSLLGPMKPTVWKLPFRLDELPFFDTTYLCDPTMMNSNYVGQDSDDEDWDAPLRRRSTLSTDIIKKQSQTRYQPINEYVDEPVDEDSVVLEPFCRDPSVPMKRRAPKPPTIIKISSEEPAPISYSKFYSPTPYTRQSVDDIRSKFAENNVVIGQKSVVYKKKTAPKVPSIYNPSDEQKLTKKRMAPQPKPDWEPKPGPEFSYSANENRKTEVTSSPAKINPIKEMQLIAQRSTDEKDEDDPPFNFQGMLRKTKYNRASMKRNAESKLTIYESDSHPEINNYPISRPVSPLHQPSLQNNNDFNSPRYKAIRSQTPDDGYIETSSNYTNVVYHSKVPDRPKSCQGRVGNLSYVASTIDIDENDNPAINGNMQLDNSIGIYIKEEILPGIILEGYVAHL